MAGKPVVRSARFDDCFVSSDVEADMRWLYCDRRLSCRELGEIFGGLSNDWARNSLRRLGIPLRDNKGENNPMWRGGIKYEQESWGTYILVHKPDHPHANSQGYVRQHRLVMEERLGRYLEPHEVVHHTDGNPSNNDPDNLMLLNGLSEHMRIENETFTRDELGRFTRSLPDE